MHNKNIQRHSLIALAISAIFSPAFAAETLKAEAIEVIGTTPVAGIGIPKDQIPGNLRTVTANDIRTSQAQNLPEMLARNLPSVTVNEVQGNPYQTDVNYRGFTASPLLGTPQGISVYLDGVRANEVFGDTVNWELIPKSALTGMELVPGSNPLYGLNTLGGAIALRTKDGFSDPGGEIEVSTGSFQRRNLEFSYGTHGESLGGFVAGNWFKEDGWRDFSESEVKQLFGKLSFRGRSGEADVSLLRVKTDMVGNGLLPRSMYDENRHQIYTHPDHTWNDLTQIAATGRWWLSDATSLSGNVYHRRNTTSTLNGDLNDQYAAPGDDTGANNRTHTRQRGTGASLQWNLIGETHQLSIGGAYDTARVNFRQTEAEGDVDGSRGIVQTDVEQIENQLRGRTTNQSLFITDTITLAPTLHLTASARYNRAHVQLTDENNPTPPNLDGDHRYTKLNPALGLTWQFLPTTTAYVGFNQGNRVPTPIELGCADPANPCSLPNSMAADPYLKQVIARTLEAGLRGRLAQDIRWNIGVFRTVNTDDILFVGTSTSQGYFTNFGKTRRQGIELGLDGRYRRVDWQVSYSHLDARYRSGACLLAENNSTAGVDPACAADEIRVSPGNRIPGLPEHSFKFGLRWQANDWLKLGGDVQAFSSQYVRGNENNQHGDGGKLDAYAILNLQATADLGGGWEAFGRINNVFNTRYETAGALAENAFTAAGNQFEPDTNNWRSETFVAPGAPRAGWVGVRYRFN